MNVFAWSRTETLVAIKETKSSKEKDNRKRNKYNKSSTLEITRDTEQGQ